MTDLQDKQCSLCEGTGNLEYDGIKDSCLCVKVAHQRQNDVETKAAQDSMREMLYEGVKDALRDVMGMNPPLPSQNKRSEIPK